MDQASNATAKESSSAKSESQATAWLTDEKRFDVYLEALKDAHTAMADFHVKMFAILLVVIGWFSTAKNPLPLLCTFRPVVYFAIVCTVGGFIGLWQLFEIIVKRGETAYKCLQATGIDETLYDGFRVSNRKNHWGLFGQFLLLFGIALLLLSRYGDMGGGHVQMNALAPRAKLFVVGIAIACSASGQQVLPTAATSFVGKWVVTSNQDPGNTSTGVVAEIQ